MNDAPQDSLATVARLIGAGGVIPYLGPGMLSLCPDTTVPVTPKALAAVLTTQASVPHKIRDRLTQAAQFIENFKHRKTLVRLMDGAFASAPTPSALHLALAASAAPLLVHTWYDDTVARAMMQARPAADWGQVQGLSQSEHFGTWTAAYPHDGAQVVALPEQGLPAGWNALLYQPLGGHAPAGNYLVSDSDFVEVLTEIDIQTPIPQAVQDLRSGRSFLFLGCRFDDQLTRAFARQIMKRSSDRHWAVLPEKPTRMEQRFLDEQRIERIALPLDAVAARLAATVLASPAAQPRAA